ncbi:hypothetical protein AAMO2058_001683000 [Amorphochlora amoebiformis]
MKTSPSNYARRFQKVLVDYQCKLGVKARERSAPKELDSRGERERKREESEGGGGEKEMESEKETKTENEREGNEQGNHYSFPNYREEVIPAMTCKLRGAIGQW